MLTYDLEGRGNKPLYEYLYNAIRRDITLGELPSGTALPSKRALARQLSVSVITVENAYAQLQTEGYIYSQPRRGFFVADLGEINPYYAKETSSMEGQGKERGEKGAALAEELPRQTEPYFADFASNRTDAGTFPFATWAKITRRILSDCQDELMQSAPSEGVYALREAIAGQLLSFRGIHVKPEQIVIGAGTEFLYGLLIQLLGFDKIYASEDPGYAKPSAVFQSFGVKHVRLPIDEQGLSLQALEASPADIVHITPSHHFPTGITMPASRRYELLRWAAQGEDRYLIEDDYDSEFRMSGRPLMPMFGMSGSEHVIYMNTFTKSLASTIRVSYMVLPLALLSRYHERLGFYSSPVPTFEQYVLAAFLREGYFEKHVNRMRNAARRRRDLLLKLVKEKGLDRYCTIQEEHAGLHFLLYVPAEISGMIFLKELKKRGIRFCPISTFYEQPPVGKAQQCYVVNYSSIREELLPEAVERILEAARESMRKQHE